MLEASEEEILVTPEGIRLEGHASQGKGDVSRGLAIILPGWEGSANSTYMVCMGRYLYRAGYSVYRLNYRDHGDTHHLNEGIFHGALLSEVADAVSQVAGRNQGGPVYLIGFSLGGNFALRLARMEISQVRRIFTVSPVLNPLASTRKLDDNPFFRAYFREKWIRSLRRKEALYPHRYNFTEVYSESSIMAMSEAILSRYSDFPSIEAYFDQYTLTPAKLEAVRVPAHIITSLDDPVVADGPYDAYYELDSVYLSIQRRGGHVGFIGPLLRTSWYEKVILKLMNADEGEL